MNPIIGAYKLYRASDFINADIRLYSRSNEDLISLFENFSVEDKDVLSVMGSGDHPIYAYLRGAKSVETFDKEPYSIYHFYLRKWVMEYAGRRSVLYKDNLSFEEILSKVVPKSIDEKKALLLWKKYFKLSKNELSTTLFSFPFSDYKDFLDDYMDSILTSLPNMNFKFYNLDLYKPVRLRKTYDVLIVSNILEWQSNWRYGYDVDVVIGNIVKLLKKGGIVICSRFGSDYFIDYDSLTLTGELEYKDFGKVGCQYTKR